MATSKIVELLGTDAENVKQLIKTVCICPEKIM
jgi:hypothetical protein